MTLSFSSTMRVAVPACVLLLMGAGCAGTSSGPTGPDGGMFRTSVQTPDQWHQIRTLDLDTQIGSIADVGTVAFAFDPEDDHSMYVGTTDNGLIYSLNGGDSWRSAAGVSSGTVTAVAVDPHDKCTTYAARANQILKTTDCLRDWSLLVSDSRSNVVFNALAIDAYNPGVIYAGTNLGDIWRSDNAGMSWRPLTRIQGFRINNFAMDPHDSRIVYVSTSGSGIVKTSDGGATWQSIYDVFQKYDGASSVSRVVVDLSIAGRLYAVSKYGLLRSDDAGASWKPLTLITAPGAVLIRAFAVNPNNSHHLVYASDTAVVSSLDEGQTWSSKKPPTTRGVAFLAFDHEQTQHLFLGAAKRTTQ